MSARISRLQQSLQQTALALFAWVRIPSLLVGVTTLLAWARIPSVLVGVTAFLYLFTVLNIEITTIVISAGCSSEHGVSHSLDSLRHRITKI